VTLLSQQQRDMDPFIRARTSAASSDRFARSVMLNAFKTLPRLHHSQARTHQQR